MNEPLTFGNFEWFKPSLITNDFIKDYNNDGEPDPKELHGKHHDYP